MVLAPVAEEAETAKVCGIRFAEGAVAGGGVDGAGVYGGAEVVVGEPAGDGGNLEAFVAVGQAEGCEADEDEVDVGDAVFRVLGVPVELEGIVGGSLAVGLGAGSRRPFSVGSVVPLSIDGR